MAQLKDITGLPPDAAELLEAVGYLNTHDLSGADPAQLVDELVKANKALDIMPENPTKTHVKAWQKMVSGHATVVSEDATGPDQESDDAREEHGPDGVDGAAEEEDESLTEEESDGYAFDIDPNLVNFEEDPEVQEMLAISPEAVPLQPSLIRRHKLAVADIPEGMLLTQCKGEVEINVMTSARLAKAQRREAEIKRTGLMVSRIRNFSEAESGDHHIKPLEKGQARESVAVSDGVNTGLRPESRRFVRGVLHPDPMSVRVAAFFAAWVELMLLACLVGIPWLLIYEQMSGNSMFWWVIGLSSGLVLSAFCYLFWGLGARCRVCGQRQFAPKKCLKNKKAHHIPVIGYIFPTALHAMFFKWFYCTYCGTAVRLKK
ncbi:MAG: DUF4332 domain-containing protein [Akkermansiaceae bacterium]|nr:DUF4332 domain-containing protein [Akkermansiaceae bacterium]